MASRPSVVGGFLWRPGRFRPVGGAIRACGPEGPESPAQRCQRGGLASTQGPNRNEIRLKHLLDEGPAWCDDGDSDDSINRLYSPLHVPDTVLSHNNSMYILHMILIIVACLLSTICVCVHFIFATVLVLLHLHFTHDEAKTYSVVPLTIWHMYISDAS